MQWPAPNYASLGPLMSGLYLPPWPEVTTSKLVPMTPELSKLDALLPRRQEPRQPVLFLGHGSPMNALGGPFFETWQALGTQFGAGKRWAKPQLILCISAHWLTQGWWLTAMAQPKTIHDFGGFPPSLFAQQYPVAGAPEVAQALSEVLQQPDSGKPLGLDTETWGLDHGAWGVLKPMFPQADIPVIQLSMPYENQGADHVALGRQLLALRERGVLVVGSGNVVHNLRTMQRQAADGQAYAWAAAFDGWVAQRIEARDVEALQNWASQGQAAELSQPTHEHYLPLLYAAAATDAQDKVSFFNDTHQLASISMRSVIWA